MKKGDITYFCNCLLKNLKDHGTATDSSGNCVYCGHACVRREVTEKDIRNEYKHGKVLLEKKKEALDLLVKEIRHKEKIN